MGGRLQDPGWRDRKAGELLLRHFPGLEVRGPTLVAGDPLTEVIDGLRGRGVEAIRWNRRVWGGRSAAPWPPRGPFECAALRLPRSKGELAMALAGVGSALLPGGPLLVYGAKDEGVASAATLMAEYLEGVETLGVGGHCRVLKGVRGTNPLFEGDVLQRWREVHPLDLPGLPDRWVSYPGVFAQGHMDPGTRLLLAALPPLERSVRILDYGCGSGIIGAFLLGRYPGVRVHFSDVDCVALEAARENVPEGVFHLREGLPFPPAEPYDAIVTNPPFHRGKEEEPGLIRDLIERSPQGLSRRGRLILVAQRRLPLEGALRAVFQEVALLAHEGGFRVWEGRLPR